MNAEPFVERVLEDEGLTGDLDGPEATALIAWLTGQVRQVAAKARSEKAVWQRVDALCRQARQAARIVAAWQAAPGPEVIDRARQAGLKWPAGKVTSASELLQALLGSAADA